MQVVQCHHRICAAAGCSYDYHGGGVQVVEEIYDRDAATVMGIEREGQVNGHACTRVGRQPAAGLWQCRQCQLWTVCRPGLACIEQL